MLTFETERLGFGTFLRALSNIIFKKYQEIPRKAGLYHPGNTATYCAAKTTTNRKKGPEEHGPDQPDKADE